jgi:hypothetical protein
MCSQPFGRLGLGLAARSSHRAARVPARDVLATWSPRAALSRDDAVVRSPTGRWWLVGGKVLPVSSWGPLGGRRAMRAEGGLTEGGGRLRPAPGAAGEDERGEGSPK